MRYIYLLLSSIFFVSLTGFGQIAVGPGTPTPAASAMLDVQSTTSGVLIPRLTTAQRTGIASPATSLIVYQTDGTAGFYYYDGTVWQLLATGSGGTGYIQNQVTANQAAGFRITGNGLFNGGQVGIGTIAPDVSAILDISSGTKGIRLPQVSLSGGAAAAGSVPTPATGLVVYNTFTGGTVPNDVSPGYYYNSGTTALPTWKRFATSSSVGDAWVITGNNNITSTAAPATYGTSTFAGQNFIGTSTATDVIFGSSNIERMRLQSSGNLTIGSAVNGAKLDVHQTAGTAVGRFTTHGNTTDIELRMNNGTQAAPAAPTSAGTILARIYGQGYDGSSYTPAGSISIALDAAGGTASDMPGRLIFNTTLDGTGSPVERMRIDNAGKVGINLTPSMRLDVTDASTTTNDATIRGVATGAAKVYGILGTTNSTTTNASGVRGYASATTGANNGVWGESASSTGSGVYGLSTNAGGDGIFGSNNAAAGAGLGAGVYGVSTQYGGAGVWGNDASSNINGNGVVGVTTLGNGVTGYGSGDGSWGVYGQNYSTGTGFAQIGILGEKTGATGTGTGYGVWGSASGSGTFNIGGYFVATAATNSIALRLGASTSGFVNISPAATTTSYSITLPSAVAATAGAVLTSSTTGVTSWTSVASLGTGSFVDLTTAQTAAGAKTWSSLGTFSAGVTVTGATAVTGATTVAGVTNINASNNAVTNIGTGTTTSAVTIGNAANTVAIAGGTNTVTGTTTVAGTTNINASNNAITNIGTGTTTSAVTIGNTANTVAIAGGTNTVTGTTNTITGATNINASNNAVTNIGTGTTTSAVTIGNTANTVAIAGGTNTVTGTTNINTNNNTATNINTGTSTGAVTIGGNGTQTIAIADNAAGAKTVNIGNTVAGSTVNINTASAVNVTGNLNLTTPGNKIKIATGANASIGTATLSGGTITVNTTAVATGSIIMVSINTPAGTPGFISVPVASIVNGTSFVINSSNGADTSTINWWIIN